MAENVVEREEKESEQHKNNLSHLYCIYKYENNEAHLLSSNLINESENILRLFITKKLSSDLLAKDGKVSSLDLSTEDKKMNLSCFYTLVNKPGISETISEDLQNVEASLDQYVVCFLTPDLSLELFRPELQEYATKIVYRIDTDFDISDSQIHSEITQWYDYAINYISRCLERLQNDISKLLHVALMNWVLLIESDDDKLMDNIQRFVKICNLPQYLGSVEDNEKSEAHSSHRFSVKLILKRDANEFDVTDFPPYCETLGRDLLKYKHSPFTVKHFIENCKSSIFQDLNLFRRILNEAEKDYYALYRCHVFLKNLRYRDLILHHVKALLPPNCSTMDVIKVLEEFGREKTKILNDP